MNREQAIALVGQTFREKFDEARFIHFIRNVVNHLDETKRAQFSGNIIKRAFAERVGHYLRLGTYTDTRGERVDVLVIHLARDTTLTRGRVTLRNFVADYLSTGHGQGKAAVIAAFVSPAEDDWRFSFVKLDFTLETTNLGIVTERAQLTPARRYSYLVGKNENCHTAQKQFLELLQSDYADPTVAALEAAFSVEKVTKEFFEHYRELFEKTRDALARFLESARAIADEFAQRGITHDDFAKKLLGQIVFLYFLQKKGWFGVARRHPWGRGRKDFIRHLFTHRVDYSHVPGGRKREANFFNDILEPLFYEALAYPREADDHYYSRFDCRIPFLNGGLFEPLYGYKWADTDILLPDTLFSNEELSEDGDTGTGILDVFDRYNFTVNEAEPLEKEVAVDPEMLGKVFENLLPEYEKHRSGTYYTPRVIVHYMCQQALVHYLAARAPEIPSDELARFLRLAERFADFEATDTKAHADKRLPPAIASNAAQLDELLNTVTVCDPAIGSGAFPVGMMHEIVRARLALTPALEKQGLGKVLDDREPRTAYGLKRHAIHHSLYGVDSDPGAVEIAKLRLWLSMVVDEEEIGDIKALPNLDYKIMQGNSLLEEFDGIRLLDEKLLRPPDVARVEEISALKSRIAANSVQAIRHHRAGARGAAPKLAAEQEVKRLQKQLAALVQPTDVKLDVQGELTQQTSWASLQRIQQLHTEFFDESNRAKKEKLRAELDHLEWDFMRATLREQGKERALAELERASSTHRKPFFLWRLHFGEVFQQRGGFDVVIANPPFVRMELIKDDKPALERRFPHLFAGRADLYVYFYGLGLDILRADGCLTFISSNTYLNAKFAEKLRKHFLDVVTVTTLIDFAETNVFDAVVEPAIIVLRKSMSDDTSVRCVKWQENQPLDDLPEIATNRAQRVEQRSFSREPWRLVAGAESRLLRAFNRSTPLRSVATDGILYGVKTGLNAAFIIDATKRAELCEDPRSSEIIKPFVRGRDISRWSIRPIEAWLIYTYHGVDIRRYPLIEDHLRPQKKALEARATRQAWYELQQPQFRYSKLFAKPKVIYQDISRTYAFAYDTEGCFCGDTTFVLPTPSLAVVGILQSNAMKWWVHTDQGVPFGGFLRLKAQYMERCPIPAMKSQEEAMIARLAEYLLWLHRSGVASGELPNSTGGTLMADYFEQWVNAFVYELFFPEPLHAAGLHFFRLAEAAKLEPLPRMKPGTELARLRAKFEELYQSDHPLRQSLFALDSIDEVRIIEGKT
jgi:type I restriction-modification system DNA methylase subunit